MAGELVVEEEVVGEDDGWGEGGDDAGVSGGSGSPEAICWSSSAGTNPSRPRSLSRSLLLAEWPVGRLSGASPGDLTNSSTSDGRAFSWGRRPSMVRWQHATWNSKKVWIDTYLCQCCFLYVSVSRND